MRHLKSFREFLESLRNIGELREIGQEVDWNLEMGAVTRRSMDLRAPAPLFRRIKGIEPGFRALGAPGGLSAQRYLTYSRINLALGLDVLSTSFGNITSTIADNRDIQFGAKLVF
jgi:UbiD family decarboxylase